MDVLVLGGGIVGVATAVQCAQRGLRCTVVERGLLGAAATGRNQGLMIDPHPEPCDRLARRSLALYLALHRQTGGAFALDRDDLGCLQPAWDPALLDAAHGGEDARLLSPAEACDEEPQLAVDVAGAILAPRARRIDPQGALGALIDEARSFGVAFHAGCEAKGLVVQHGRCLGALTDAGDLRARTTVIAAGPWSSRLCRGVGYDVPVHGVRGWILTTRPAPFRLRRPLEEPFGPGEELEPTLDELADGVEPPSRVAVLIQQDADGRVHIGAGRQASVGAEGDDRAIVRAIAGRARRLVPALGALPIASVRSCLRPTSRDGMPLHGPVPGVEGLVLACGHGATGVTLGPGSGEAVARGIVDGAWLPELLPARFPTTGVV